MKHLIRKYFEKGMALKLNLCELTHKRCSKGVHQLILKSTCKFKRPNITKAILKWKKKVVELSSKTYLQSYSNQKVWYYHRHIHQWNRNEGPETNTYICGQLILTKMPRQFNGEGVVFSINNGGTTRYQDAKYWIWMLNSHHTQNLTPNGPKT